MLLISVVFGSALLTLLLASGLLVLWRRGAEDLDAWGRFVSRILRGDNHHG